MNGAALPSKAPYENGVPSVRPRIRVAARPAFRNEGSNPHNSLLYRAVSSNGTVVVREHTYSMLPSQCDIVHLHWPEYDVLPGSARQIAKMAVAWTWLLAARLAGVKIVWTAHNSFQHDKEPFGPTLFVWKRFLSMLDGVIFPSEESRRLLTTEYPTLAGLPSALIKLGDFFPWIRSVRESAALPAPTVARALASCGDAFVVLNFGLIRPYKNVDALMREFSSVVDPNVRLLVAGKVPSGDYLAQLQALAQADDRIVLIPQHLDDASLVACLDRADLVVLPYRKILNSGAALMAMSFGKHVVLPAVGSMFSLQRDVGIDAVTLFEGKFDAAVLRAAIERVRSSEVTAPNLEAYAWPLLAGQMTEYYHDVMKRPKRGPLSLRP